MKLSTSNIRRGRIIALHLTSRGFGYGVIESGEELIDWGVTELHGKYTIPNALKAIQALIERNRPEAIVVPKLAEASPSRVRVRKFLTTLISSSWKIVQLPESQISAAFPDSKNKFQRAKKICSLFPFLTRYLPKARLFYMPEQYRQPLFDAIVRGTAYFQGRTPGKGQKAARL